MDWRHVDSLMLGVCYLTLNPGSPLVKSNNSWFVLAALPQAICNTQHSDSCAENLANI